MLTISVLNDAVNAGSDSAPPGGPDTEEPDTEEPDTEEPNDSGVGPGADGGDQGPLAVTPLECESCLGENQIGATIPADPLLEDLGLTVPYDYWGDYPPYRAGTEIDFHAAGWARDGGTDDACFFTYPTSPVGPTAQGVGSRSDTVEYTGTFTDTKALNSVLHSVRVFSSSTEAVAYLTALHSAIRGCDRYTLASGWEPTVAPAQQFSLPDDVAVVGFVETRYPDALHVVNLQRGNLVVHVAMWSSRGGPSAEDFRAFVEGLAVQISEIDAAG